MVRPMKYSEQNSPNYLKTLPSPPTVAEESLGHGVNGTDVEVAADASSGSIIYPRSSARNWVAHGDSIPLDFD